ncbi:hypothetical protein [Mycoplasmoides pneumoniae]|uniref:hypothetical protein n=1 Tax=Mycoplasmoides pneumoniae TaxID=2104 RepID=UPI00056FD0B1|nr:hypothetical protein [Mycoplasmoides pneumoniae]ALX06677.1 hypothetical protein AVK85_02055 [Mycoplasmoides pneumoniae]AMF84517.1 hypothetical protein AXA72_02135 [Mycoplasmoides pneumoniae]GLL61447.1 hypothetical protein OA631U_6120 [Mycoplasmoides pneumoniae]
MNGNESNGHFYVVVDVTNANNLGNQRRIANPRNYFYYLEGLDKNAQSTYIIRFETKDKFYSLDALRFDNNGIYVDNASRDAVIQARQKSKLYFNTSDWRGKLPQNFFQTTTSLSTKNREIVAHFLKSNESSKRGVLSQAASGAVVGYVERLTNKKVFLKDEIKFDVEKDGIKLDLKADFSLEQNGSLGLNDPNDVNKLAQEAQSYTVMVSDGGAQTDNNAEGGNLRIALTKNAFNPNQSTTVDIPYKIKNRSVGNNKEQKTLVFDFSGLNPYEYNMIVGALFTDSSFINDAYAPIQSTFQRQLKEFLQVKYENQVGANGSFDLFKPRSLSSQQLVQGERSLDGFTVELNANGGSFNFLTHVDPLVAGLTVAAIASVVVAGAVTYLVVRRYRKRNEFVDKIFASNIRAKQWR